MDIISRIEKLERTLDKCEYLHTRKWHELMTEVEQEVAYDQWLKIRQVHIDEWLRLLTDEQISEWKEAESRGVTPQVRVVGTYRYPQASCKRKTVKVERKTVKVEKKTVKVRYLQGDGTMMGPKEIVWEWEGSKARFEEIRDCPFPEESLLGRELSVRNVIDGAWWNVVVTEKG